MHVALEDLRLDRLFIVYPGNQAYDLHARVSAVPLTEAAAAVRSAETEPAPPFHLLARRQP